MVIDSHLTSITLLRYREVHKEKDQFFRIVHNIFFQYPFRDPRGEVSSIIADFSYLKSPDILESQIARNFSQFFINVYF